MGQLSGRMQALREAFITAIAPPAVRGVGNSGGFKLQLKENESADMTRILHSAYAIMGAAAQSDKVERVFTIFSAGSARVYPGIDRARANSQRVHRRDL